MDELQNTSNAIGQQFEEINDWPSFLHSSLEEALFQGCETLVINKKKFTSAVTLLGEFKCAIKFSHCDFIEKFDIEAFATKDVLHFHSCRFHKSFETCTETSIPTELYLVDCFVHTFCFNGGNFGECSLGLVDNSSVNVRGGTFGDLEIGGGFKQRDFASVYIMCQNTKGSVRVGGNDVRIKVIQCYESASELSLSFDHLKVGRITFAVNGDSTIRIASIEPLDQNSEFIIQRTYLGTAEFYNVDFSAFKSVNINQSHILNCSFIDIIWKDNITSFNPRSNEIDSKYYRRNKEVYRQLKYAMGKQGDTVLEQHFHSREMAVYYRILNWKSNFWTKSLVLLSSALSSFGQSINKPLFWLLGGHLTLFLLAVYFGAIPGLALFTNSKIDLNRGVNRYLFLINPVHSAEHLFPGWTILLDLLIRIWSSYMIYNFIRASRRFLK